MRIGELLLEQRSVKQSELTRVLGEQPNTRRRLCSLLIASGHVDFDDGARALGAQKGVPCALSKHLTNRDPELATLLPAELGRTWCALPLGRTSGGALIVCVRDPGPQVLAALHQAVRAEIMMVVAPATRLEHLVAAAYGAPAEEFDVDLASDVDLPPLPDMDALDPASVRLALTDLDDARVVKDPTQSGQHEISSSMSMSMRNQPRSTRPPTRPPEWNEANYAAIAPPSLQLDPPSLAATELDLGTAMSRDEATDLAAAFVAGRWSSGVVLAIREGSAIGYRGHGVQERSVDAISLPLQMPSTVQHAIETRRTSHEPAKSQVQDQLQRLLGMPSSLAAAPVIVANQVVAVIAVSEPIYHSDLEPPGAAAAELGRLAVALGSAYERIRRG